MITRTQHPKDTVAYNDRASTYNHLKREHPELDYIQLIVRTGAQRLRPVMLTTVTTVLGDRSFLGCVVMAW